MIKFKKISRVFSSTLLLISFSVLTFNSTAQTAQRVDVKKQFSNATTQIKYMLSVIDSSRAYGLPADLVSPRTADNGKIKMVKGQDWTSGFFPGELWFMYEYSGNKEWLARAKKFTTTLKPIQFFGLKVL